MYKIEENIEITPIREGIGRHPIYPFKNMEIGTSIYIPKSEGRKKEFSARRAAHGYAERHREFKFITRLYNQGLRIWRVAR